jgi:hypothetical protein
MSLEWGLLVRVVMVDSAATPVKVEPADLRAVAVLGGWVAAPVVAAERQALEASAVKAAREATAERSR